MRRARFVFDGLSRCLCPAVDEHAFARVIGSPSLLLLRPPQASLQRRPILNSKSIQRRALGTVRPATLDDLDGDAQNIPTGPTLNDFEHLQKVLRTKSLSKLQEESIIATLRLLQMNFDDQRITRIPNRHNLIVDLVKHLVKERAYPLDAFVYECMMSAMADPKGSAMGIRMLLKDISEQGIPPTPAFCSAALEALALHPDHISRAEVIAMMRQYWFEIDLPAEQMIILCMLREGQYERAFNEISILLEDMMLIDRWVFDIFIMVFCQEGFLDEALQIFHHRKHAKGTDDPFRNLLLICLDFFSRSFHIDGTVYLWETVVKNSLLNPPSGILDNVLGTAARHGNPQMATEALEILSRRGRVFKHQYEAVVDAFAGAWNIAGALGIFRIMEANGMSVGRGSSRAVHEMLVTNPKLMDDAVVALGRIHQQGPVPFEAVRVVIEAMTQTRGSESAKDLFDDVALLSGRQPDRLMMEDMIMHSIDAKFARALGQDYDVLFPKDTNAEDPRIYDRLIPACAECGDFDMAFELVDRSKAVEELRNPGKQAWQQRVWFAPLVDLAIDAQDSRIWPLVDEAEKVGLTTEVLAILRRRQATRDEEGEEDVKDVKDATTEEGDAMEMVEEESEKPSEKSSEELSERPSSSQLKRPLLTLDRSVEDALFAKITESRRE